VSKVRYEIEMKLFDEPSGRVRGVAVAMFCRDGRKPQRVAHATLLTDGGPDISLSLPKGTLCVASVAVLSHCLSEFTQKLQALGQGVGGGS
jgi:hypothetical protein